MCSYCSCRRSILAIGLIEGVITGVIVNYLFEQHPSYLYKEEKEDVDIAINRKVIGRILAAALVVGGMLSLFASASPDGLEWAIERQSIQVKSSIIHR